MQEKLAEQALALSMRPALIYSVIPFTYIILNSKALGAAFQGSTLVVLRFHQTATQWQLLNYLHIDFRS